MESTAASSGRPYAGTSASDRTAERRRRLVQAALDLVGEGGVASLTVGGVCERASVSKRYFYEGFSTLDDLLGQTLTESLQRVTTEIAATAPAWDGPIEPLQEAAVRAVLRVFDDPRVARMYVESPGHAGLRAARDLAVDGFVGQFLDLLAAAERDREAARLLVHVVVGGTTEVVAMWLRGELALGRDDLVRHLVDLGSQATRLIREL